MENLKYYPLHAHLTDGSIGDSVLKVSDYVSTAKNFGLNAIAMTDHGSLSAIYHFQSECLKNNIKPIFGMEAYVCENIAVKDKNRWHLILLAKTQKGLSNLILIHNIAQIEGFYYKPRIDFDILKKYGRGLIGLSACVAGEIPQYILQKNQSKAIEPIKNYKNCFDEFFLEIQPGNFDEQKIVNDALIKLSMTTDTPIVITNDIHYLKQDDYLIHDMHVKLSRKMNLEENPGLCYPDSCYWFMRYEDLKKNIRRSNFVTDEIIEIAVKNTEYISAVCNAVLSDKLQMPRFIQNGDEDRLLYMLCYKKLDDIIQSKSFPPKYVDRLERELTVIKNKGFSGYFLIVQDYVNYARKNNIAVGPGRGSAAGSLVSYLLGISQADPIKYNLLFERFLDENRFAIPDVDVDFSPDGRDKIKKYLIECYGEGHCALVSTFNIRKARSAFKDAARLYGVPPEIANTISKLIPYVHYDDGGTKMKDLTIRDALNFSDELKTYEKKYPEIFKLAEQLEGLPSSTGIHAAGILVSPISLTDKIPLIRTDKNILATSLNLQDAENCFVKYDLLSSAAAELIAQTEKDVDWKFDYQDDSLFQDKKVWSIIGSKNTTGIFQISSNIYRQRMPRLKPKNIEELATCLALIRAPSISAKTDQKYIEILEGKRRVEFVHPIYDKITADTKGILIFQEQVMHLAVGFGLDLSTGYSIIKFAAKKKLDELKKFRKKFIESAVKKDCDKNTANKIFDLIEKSSEYSFNTSHAVSYALMLYAGAYMKVHYKLEYMKNLLSNVWARGEKDNFQSTLKECRRLKIKFLPPDINESEWNFTIENKKIRIGLCAIKGLGKKYADKIIEARPIENVDDIIGRIGKRNFGKQAASSLILGGAFGGSKNEKIETYKNYLKKHYDEEISDTVKIGTSIKFNLSDDESIWQKEIFSGVFI